MTELTTLFKQAFEFFQGDIADSIGVPWRIRRYLESTAALRIAPPTLPTSICIESSIIHWDIWSNSTARTDVKRWYWDIDQLRLSRDGGPDISKLVTTRTTRNWSCDINDVDGVSSSKSNLPDFDSLDAMVETNSRDMIDEISDAKLAKNLAHGEIRIIHNKDTSDSFVRHGWDGRVFLLNSGGSHHFAAARYIAKRLDRRVPLMGRYTEHALDRHQAITLNSKYHMFLINESGFYETFFYLLERFKTNFAICHAPPPLSSKYSVLFFERAEERPNTVARVLKEHGFFDFNEFLYSQF